MVVAYDELKDQKKDIESTLKKINEEIKAFMKHKLETKIFDQEGKSTSSGEMTFYIFNTPFNNPLKFKQATLS